MNKPFFIRYQKVLRSINPQDVICLYTEGNYTRIILRNETYYMVRTTLSSALKKLPSDIFIKTHRSFAVSVFCIDTVARDHLTIGKEVIPIARQYYFSVMKQLNIIGM